MELIEISPSERSESLLFKRTPNYHLSKDYCIKVDEGYIADIRLVCNVHKEVRGSIGSGKLKPKRIYRLVGKEYIGIGFYVIFRREQSIPDMSWAVGNVLYDYGNKKCIFGTRGDIAWSIKDHVKLSGLLPESTGAFQRSTVENVVKSRLTELFRGVLMGLFEEVGIAVNNESFLKDEFESRLNEQFAHRDIPELPGILISGVRLSAIVIRTYASDDPAVAARLPDYVRTSMGDLFSESYSEWLRESKGKMPELLWNVVGIGRDYGESVCSFSVRGGFLAEIKDHSRFAELYPKSSENAVSFQKSTMYEALTGVVQALIVRELKKMIDDPKAELPTEVALKEKLEGRLNERYSGKNITELSGVNISRINVSEVVINAYDPNDPDFETKAPEHVRNLKGAVK